MTGTLEHELDAPPWLRVEATLMATSRAIRRAYDVRLSGVGLNLSELSLLAFVQVNGPLAQTQLADRLGIGCPATGGLVDALERRALVERQRHPTDRRVWRVAATPAAAPMVAEIDVIDARLRQELRAGITKVKRHALAQKLIRLQANLAQVLSQAPGTASNHECSQ